MEDRIIILALENAIKFNGKANPGAIVGKVISEFPDAKNDMASLMKIINEKVRDVNEMNPEEQKLMLKELAPEEKVDEKKERNIFGFMGIEDGAKIRTAFPPGLEKYPHIGHAKACFTNYLLAKQYNGEFIVRFEDTNSDLVKKEYYDIMEDNLRWLGVKWDGLFYASDMMDKYYSYAEKLIQENKAYMCTCDADTISANRKSGTECECRKRPIGKNLDMWYDFPDYDAGKAVLRLKIDMSHKNSTMRDPAAFRVNKSKHARHGNKYKVWPTYDFQTAVADGLNEVTHRIRTKEFEMRTELHQWIQRVCNFPVTKYYEVARFNMTGVLSSGRVIREGIEKGELIGWDDPTLTTLVALRRRGFQPEAIKNFVMGTGLTKSESTMTWDDLIMHNKRVLDRVCSRYFFVKDPVRIQIKGSPVRQLELRLHPEDKSRGFRKFSTNEYFLIAKEDIDDMKDGDMHRLIDGINFIKHGDSFEFDSHDFNVFRENGKKIVHWLPADEPNVETEIMMPDKTIVRGMAEKDVSGLNEGDVIQFERFGFCRLDDKEKMRFWFTH